MRIPKKIFSSALSLLLAAGLTACAMVQGVNEPGSAQPAAGAPETVYERSSANSSAAASGSEQAGAQTGGHRQTYNRDEIIAASKTFFGNASEDFARLIERAFADYGEPVAYIAGEEGAGAFVAGLRYGQGYLQYKDGARSPIFWQGPSVGYDFGGNASKVFTLIYNLNSTEQLYQRFPGVEGAVYVVAGFGLNYQKSGDIVLAPIRTGVGLRAGANVGYVHYTREPSYLPF